MPDVISLLPLLTCAACGKPIKDGVEYKTIGATVLVCEECDAEEQGYEGMYN
jgi:ribosome-binding protein aMBF1 (putative translation factor)